MRLQSGLTSQIWNAVRELNPGRPVEESLKPCVFSIVGSSQNEIDLMQDFLCRKSSTNREMPPAASVISEYMLPVVDAQLNQLRRSDIILLFAGTPEPRVDLPGGVFCFDPAKPEDAVKNIIESRYGMELRLTLARHVPAFRLEVARRVLRDVSMENAVFVLTTALGSVIPSVLLPLVGIAEAASDTVVLTANQVRMLFILGAIHGAEVGYKSQWKEITSIIGAAFGWRALARELVSKIPFGGGLVPKGAIAYAGTTAVGEGLIFYYTTGRHMTKSEVRQAFKDSYSRAQENAQALAARIKPKT
ncbi:MAG TPA: hypothetical protein VGK34_03100 [Armatimonadota bacterium]|jgi:uncharacterized protein (DUF697 family)